MILYQDAKMDPVLSHERAACLECMAQEHTLFCFSTIQALEEYLEKGLDELAAAGYPRGLARVVVITADQRAIAVVAKRMLPGKEFIAWPQPEAWRRLYQEIEKLRGRAQMVNPAFMPRHVVQSIGGR